MEKRRNQRMPLVLGGELTIGDRQSHFAETKDVSLGGACLDELPDSVQIGEECLLTLFIDDEDTASPVTFRGRIAANHDNGCGVEFLGVDQKEFAIFSRLLLKRALQTDAVREELERGQVPDLETWESALFGI